MKPRIAIVGSGSIGLYYGLRLALHGEDVRFLMRSGLDVARSRGISVILTHTVDPAVSSNGHKFHRELKLSVDGPKVFASPEEIGPVDFVLVTLKATSNGDLPLLLPPLLKKDTVVLTLQNGLGNEEFIAGIVGADRVMGGLCFIAVTRTGPAEVTCFHPGTVTIGETARTVKARTLDIVGRFENAGVRCTVTDNLMEARWRKLVWNVPFNGLAIAAGGITTDRILSEHLGEVRALMDEVAATARRLGFTVPEEFIQKQIDVTRPMGAYQPSSLVDFRAGRAVEVEAIWGEPLRRARAAGVPTPRLEALYRRIIEKTAPSAA